MYRHITYTSKKLYGKYERVIFQVKCITNVASVTFGKILAILAKLSGILRVNFTVENLFNLLWQILCAIWQIIMAKN